LDAHHQDSWRDAAGNVIGIIGGGRNITPQKEAELKLTRSAICSAR